MGATVPSYMHVRVPIAGEEGRFEHHAQQGKQANPNVHDDARRDICARSPDHGVRSPAGHVMHLRTAPHRNGACSTYVQQSNVPASSASGVGKRR